MKKLFFIPMFMLLCFSCTSTKDSSSSTSTTSAKNVDYQLLATSDNFDDFVGKSVYFNAKIAKDIMQHMMFTRIDEPDNWHQTCVDMVDKNGKIAAQMYVYGETDIYKALEGKEEKSFKVYGKFDSMHTERGKGGQPHTEYYLLVDKIEVN